MNQVSRVRKGGFRPRIIQRQAEYRNGRYQDLLMMSILRHVWTPPAL